MTKNQKYIVLIPSQTFAKLYTIIQYIFMHFLSKKNLHRTFISYEVHFHNRKKRKSTPIRS